MGVQVSQASDQTEPEQAAERPDVSPHLAGVHNIMSLIPPFPELIFVHCMVSSAYAGAQWPRGLHRLGALLCVLLKPEARTAII